MFIEIEHRFIDRLYRNNSSKDQRLFVVQSLFTAMMIGKHIVFARYEDLVTLKKCEYLSQIIKEYLKWVIERYVDIYSCKNSVSVIIEVSENRRIISYKRISQEEKIIYVPFKFFKDVNETKLLSENERDAGFYDLISQYIYKKKNLSSFYNINFEFDSYHGGNARSAIHQVAKKNNIALCIVDSDKSYYGGKYGHTYNDVKEGVSDVKKSIPISKFVLPVREKENLLPISVYKEFTDNKLIKVIGDFFENNDEISFFFDIKQGIKVKQMSTFDNKWKKKYKILLNKCESENVCEGDLCILSQKDMYIKGIGSDICDWIAEVIFSEDDNTIDNHFSRLNVQKKNWINHNKSTLLGFVSPTLMLFWEEISKVMFDWGCCINQNIYPVTREWNVKGGH